MLNFRKLKQDFSSNIVKEGKELYEKERVLSAKLLHLDPKTMKVSAKVMGQYDNCYESEIEIDRMDCETIDSDCDCPYNYDCQHLAALLFYLEEHLDKIVVSFSKENDLSEIQERVGVDEEAKKKLLEQIRQAESKEVQRQEEEYQRQLLQEYVNASQVLASSVFFRPQEKVEVDLAEFVLIYSPNFLQEGDAKGVVEVQFSLRLPFRSKPLHIGNVRQFLEALRYEEPIFIGGKRYCFSLESFDAQQREIVQMVRDHACCLDVVGSERALRVAQLDIEVFGMILARAYEIASVPYQAQGALGQEEELPTLLGIYEGSWEVPLRFSPAPAQLRFSVEHIPPPVSKILINPTLLVGEQSFILEEARFFYSAKPGMLFRGGYYRFSSQITRTHLRNLKQIREMTIPEPLFGAFVENALPQISSFAEVANPEAIEDFVTIPFAGEVEAVCEISYLDGELDALLHFNYQGNKVPAAPQLLTREDISSFVTDKGILARNLVEERKIIEDLFQDFLFNPETGVYVAKSDKRIVEFMTDAIPRNQHRVQFHCPQNLLDQFIYDQTRFALRLEHTSRVDQYEIHLEVDGALRGVRLDQLWECMGSKKAFIELDSAKNSRGRKGADGKLAKILVLDLGRLHGVVQLFDEMGIVVLENHRLERPLWSLANIDEEQFDGLPVTFSMSEKLSDIRKQMLGEKSVTLSRIPKEIKATLRSYQVEGVNWLERLRSMFLNGILADDMGLGKTLQAIVALAQHRKTHGGPILIVCPTSLLYNWKEEFSKFNPKMRTVVVDGIPSNRKKWIEQLAQYDVFITSYTLLQKDVDLYKAHQFLYLILDEAQHIKNRGTRNARSVKQIPAEHRLILSGTPIENSLEELWSLFDFLMPGFLSTYDRFIEKYVRMSGKDLAKNLEYLRKKVSPFILRRMKSDVLDDLPPISEIVYHCALSDVQMDLYRSYAQSARDELVRLVEKEGFDRVQIHVLATLTRLKQICCHPAIFAKEKAESGDSAKYEMLLELLQTLIEGKHKTVIFSQYTRMLQIMREDFEHLGIRFAYLDGSSKNRLEVVKEFNESEGIPVFLVSLKAGGTGLNLVGADTVIHYDMWWNPAVESQATDRVHRLGQKNSVSAYKLITLGTIEEKIAEMQKKKKGLVKKVVSCDDEAMEKLTWEDVLELLKT